MEALQNRIRITFAGEGGRRSIVKRYLTGKPPEYVNPGDTGEFEKPMEVGGLQINIRIDVPYAYNWKASSKTSKVDTYSSFRVANVIIIVYDVCDRDSFTECESWLPYIGHENASPPLLLLFVANQVDRVDERKVATLEGEEFVSKTARKHPNWDCRHVEASAKTGHNINEIFLFSAKEVIKAYTGTLIQVDNSELSLFEPIGEGSSSSVYRGALWWQRAAVKKLKLCRLNESLQAEFITDAKVLWQIKHDGIVKLLGYTDPAIERPSLVMEFMEGGTLYTALHSYKRPLPYERIACDIAEALYYLHSQQPPIIHRDIKSSSIFLDNEGRAKISDFGFAKLKQATFQTAIRNPAWKAPEILTESTYDTRADVYSFGVILFELFTQTIPWEEFSSAAQISAAIRQGQKLKVPLTLPKDWKLVVDACLATKPAERPTISRVLCEEPMSTLTKSQYEDDSKEKCSIM